MFATNTFNIINIILESVTQKECEESVNLLNLAVQLKEEADKGKEEVKEMEEGGDLLNLVLKWKQKQVLAAEARSSKQVSNIQLSS